MDLKEIGWGSIEWIQLAQDRGRWWAPVDTVMNLRVLAPVSWSTKLILHACVSDYLFETGRPYSSRSGS
jgi:hypothetical protein